VEFKGKGTIKVRYVLTYREGKLVMNYGKSIQNWLPVERFRG
jgi:hypothetical protein